MPILFVCILIFMAWFTYERSKKSKKDSELAQTFWDREEEANHTRKKDISALEYLVIDDSQIPQLQTDNEELLEARKRLLPFLNQKMLDLSSYSNTDLKLNFGVGNYTELSSYDTNYTNFLAALSTYSKKLLANHYLPEAQQCYSLLLKIGSNRLEDYQGLAKTYLALDKPEEIPKLISEVSESSFPRKDHIITALKQALSSYQ